MPFVFRDMSVRHDPGPCGVAIEACALGGLKALAGLLLVGALQACAPLATVPPSPAGEACSSRAAHWPTALRSLAPLGVAEIRASSDGPARNLGGISGIDYDAAADQWLLISDDRSEQAPARFYTAKMALTPKAAGQVDIRLEIQSQHALRRPDGSLFARYGSGSEPSDAEALRLDPCRPASLVWASEGDQARGFGPKVRRTARDGSFEADVPLPANLAMAADGLSGPRANSSFEGLTFEPDGRALWLSMEAPLLQDGELPTPTQGALVRFTRLPRGGQPQQFAYPVDAVVHAGSGGQRRHDNGVSEILAVDAQTLLVVERNGHETAEGVFGFDIRLYLASTEAATQVQDLATLRGQAVQAMAKRLLLNLADAGLGTIDNIEAAAWGPRLADGRASLLLMSDDNFSPQQRTQLLLFAVQER